MVTSVRRAIIFAASMVFSAASAWPQASVTGSIAGVARDTTGAVLPGVTVEVASPALIEKVRVAITDDQGQYKILDLRPGVYSVSFSLPGFSTVKREGIELSTGFTATVNGELRVGSLEETITVTGASPVVDTQNVRNQSVLSRNVLEMVPSAHTTQGYASLTLGVSIISQQQDVGGNRGESVTASSIHGNRSADASRTLDGMGINTMLSTGGGVNYYYKINDVMAQEVTITTDGQSAEYETGGIVTNVVPKAGGNVYSLYGNAAYADKKFQSDNYSDALRARGLAVPPSVKRIDDFGVGVGGPIRRDKLWFYTGHRRWDALQEQAGQYYNATPHTLFYTPDLGRPAFLNNWAHDHSVRLTWQVNAKNKINYFQTYQRSCTCDLTGSAAAANLTPEASTEFHYDPIVLPQVTWNYAPTNRLLFEAGGQYLHQTINSTRTSDTRPSDIGVRELATGITYGASTGSLTSLTAYGGPNQSSHGLGRFAMSYVTGSHAVKVGATLMSGIYDVYGAYEIPYSYTFRNQVPVSLTQYATPHYSKSRLKMNLGIYAQDQWTVNRLTLNLGVRYSHFNAFNPEQTRPAGPFVAALSSPRQDNVPNWKDLDPRLGAAYDLFGNGKTAVKMSLGRYVAAMATGLAQANNPANAMVTQATRAWNDSTFPVGDARRGNYFPDCDFTNTLANGECGALDNQRFGTVVTNTRYAEDVLNGFGVRPYTWQGSVALQHELRPNVALLVGYFRTWYGNFYVSDNLRVTAADFDPFCVTAPADARLPGGGGYQICGLADPKPSVFGQVENLVSQASNFGDVTQVFNGVDVSINARFGHGGVVSGGVSTGRTVYDTCDVLQDSAPTVGSVTPVGGGTPWVGNARNCRQTLPWRAQTQFKFHGIYPLPFWGIQASATFQNLPGVPAAGNYVATNAEIVPSLGRNLSSCGAAAACAQTVTVPDLYEPNTRLEDRLSQVDLRFTKVLRIGRARLRPSFDVYNVFNASTISFVNATYGTTWLSPRGILPGRLVKIGTQFDF